MIRAGLMALGLLAVSVVAAQADPVPEGEYRLTRIDGARPGYLATLRIGPGDNIGGRGPCNIFSGPLKKPLPDFRPGALMVTRRACPELADEQRFLDRLRDGRSVSFAGGELTLAVKGADPLVFIPYK